jgi:hypothetical protein
MICLPKELVDRFVQGLKDNKLNPETLANMSSEERRALLSQFVGGGDAPGVNALFESKLLMKNQETAMISWVKSVAGLKPKIQRELIDRVNKLGKVLTPIERESFFNDLAAHRLGTEVTAEQAQKISELANKFNKAKANPNSGLEYGASEVALNNYVNDIKLENGKQSLNDIFKSIKKDPASGTIEQVSNLAGVAKGIKASLDNSSIFRQGWKTMFTNPTIWAKNASQSFVDIAKQLGSKPSNNTIIDGVRAEILSRPNARNGMFKNMKLDIGNLEEAFPTALPEKIPLFGRLYKASETAYTGFLYRMRADIADKMINLAQEQGVNLADKAQSESIGKLVNSLTGRGSLGSLEKIGKEVNTIFFSPKNLKSSFDFLTAHQLQKGVTPFVRKQAATNLFKAVGGMATIMGIAEALRPGSVEFDPRSSDFGKIKIGNTRFSIGGGMESLVTLAARIVKQSTKSSTTGKVTKLGTGTYGSKTGVDVVIAFGENKLSPISSLIKDLLSQQDFNGNPISFLPSKKNEYQGELINLLAPLPITNTISSLQDPKSANIVLTTIADALGIATNTYGSKKK